MFGSFSSSCGPEELDRELEVKLFLGMLGWEDSRVSAGFIGLAGPGGSDLRNLRRRNGSRLAGTAIMRCNSDFHGRNRRDCIVLDGPNRSIEFARLAALLRCWLASGTILDLGLIQRTSSSRWRPSTMWDGCRVVEQQQGTSLILAESAVRGALLCPVSDDHNEKAYYVVDTVDGDMFLCLNF